MTRVAVFFDWQNAYRSARRAFELKKLPNEHGNFCPLAVARLVASRNARGSSGHLVRVEIHRGLPSTKEDAIGNGAVRRQSQAGMARDRELVIPRLRPLWYPSDGGPPQEKGVDVALAVSIIDMAIRSEFDVAVLFSNDTDLLPVIEMVQAHKGKRSIETAAWDGPGSKSRLHGAGFHHFLKAEDFERCKEVVNYAYRGGST